MGGGNEGGNVEFGRGGVGKERVGGKLDGLGGRKDGVKE